MNDKEKLLLLDLILQDLRGNWGFDVENRIATAFELAEDLGLSQFIQSINEFDWLYEDYKEEEYVYKDEETMLAHRKQMEEAGYKTYNCGMKAWFSGNEITSPNSTFWKYEVDIPTATYGIRVDGLYKKLGKY